MRSTDIVHGFCTWGSVRWSNTRALLVLVGALLAPPALAAAPAPIQTNVNLTGINLNPWAAGPSFEREFSHRIGVSGGIDESLRLNPAGAILDGIGRALRLDDLGISLGSLASVGLNFNGNGSAGLNVGYYVSGGGMTIAAPGLASTSVKTFSGNDLLVGSKASIQSTYTPGLNRNLVNIGDLRTQLQSGLFGDGYTWKSPVTTAQRQLRGDIFEGPTFRTAFPYAEAYADLEYSFRGRGGLEGCLLFQCARLVKEFNRSNSIPIVDVNPYGYQILGMEERQPLAGQTFEFPSGRIALDYPDVQVSGSSSAADPLTLRGSAAKEILTIQGDLSKLIPFVGPFLNNAIGPVDFTMLEVFAGPVVSLYQDFTVKLIPKVSYAFSELVSVFTRVGDQIVETVTDMVSTLVGQILEFEPFVPASDKPLLIRPTYSVDAEITNHTGFGLGYSIDVNALGVLGLGPFDVAEIVDLTAVKLDPFYRNTFTQSLGSVTTAALSFDVLSPLLESDGLDRGRFIIEAFRILSSGESESRIEVTVREVASGALYTQRLTGQIERVMSALDPSGKTVNTFLLTQGGEVELDVGPYGRIPVGGRLCLDCRSLLANLPAETPRLDLGDAGMFYANVLDLSTIRDDAVSADHRIFKPLGDPMLMSLDGAETVERFSAVPEPMTLPMAFLAMLMVLLSRSTARRRAGT